MSKRIAGVMIEEQKGKRKLFLWITLPPKQRQQRQVGSTTVLLAIAVIGLVILLVLQFDPSIAKLLIQLLTIASP